MRLQILLVSGLALAACGDDTATGTGGAGGGSGGGDATTSSTSGSPTATSSASSTVASSSSSASGTTSSTASGDQGGGGAGGEGAGGDGAGGVGGAGGDGAGGRGAGGAGGEGGGSGGAGTGGEGGGANVCPDFEVGDESDDTCDDAGDLTELYADSTPCADLELTWPARIYEIDVEAGDCVTLFADNAGTLGADVFGAIVDPEGNNVLLDDEVDCTVPPPGGFSCPLGAITMAASGTAHIIVGAYADDDVCPIGTFTDYQVAISVNGEDVALEPPVCTGDLFVIVP